MRVSDRKEASKQRGCLILTISKPIDDDVRALLRDSKGRTATRDTKLSKRGGEQVGARDDGRSGQQTCETQSINEEAATRR